jgi:hypothetical protein
MADRLVPRRNRAVTVLVQRRVAFVDAVGAAGHGGHFVICEIVGRLAIGVVNVD